MNTEANAIFDAALALPAESKAILVSKLLESLEEKDPQIDEAWAEEAEKRLEAFEHGKLTSIPADRVFQTPPSKKQQ